jgi:acyl carrier protein
MPETEILETLTRILRDLLGDDDIVLTMTTTRPDVKGWDSMAYVNIIVATEMEFGIRFQIADAESFVTVGDIVRKIQSLKGWAQA